MHTLPAVVPEGEFPRSEVVAVRLARKVGPLFGVRWEHNPFARTWVCDFGSLTLAEIARGAPLPTKEEQADLDARREQGATVSPDPATPRSAGTDWGWAGRAVWTPERAVAPSAIANATLNRFGPHTKAAVVLTAANRLLDDATTAVKHVCRHLNHVAGSPHVRLAVWAGLILEVFRGQPALVVAAIQARAIQRSLTTQWGTQVGLGGLSTSPARCEIGASTMREGSDPWHPTSLKLIDETLEELDLATAETEPVGLDRREDIAAAWCRRLLQMGRPGSGMVWLVEDEHGHRAAHSYQRVGAMVAPFVAEVLDVHTMGGAHGGNAPAMPRWPPDQILTAAQPMTVRAHAVAAHVAANYLRYVREALADTRTLHEQTRAMIEQATAATTARLGPNDPATLLLTGYGEYLHLWDHVRSEDSATEDVIPAVEVLLAGQRRTRTAWHAQRLDPGAASYLLEIGNVALIRAQDRLTDVSPAWGREMTRSWRELLIARGVDPDPASRLDDLNRSQVFHLANYAEYLASRASTSDLRRALRVFEAVARVREQVAANEPAALPAKHAAVRDAHQSAAAVAARLASALPPRERSARAAAWAAATRHALAVLADPSTDELVAGSNGNDLAATWIARRIEPALTHLVDTDPDAWAPHLRSAAVRLLERARAHIEPAACIVREDDTRLHQLHLRLALSPAPAPR